MALFAVCSEFWFFHVHWALHRPLIYPHVHKVHHEFTAPIAFECLYFHPIESLLQLGTLAAGPLIVGTHALTLYAWIAIALFVIMTHHCGHSPARTAW